MNFKHKTLFPVILGLFLFTGIAFGQNPTVQLASTSSLNLQESGGNKGYPEDLEIEFILSEALPEGGGFIKFTFTGGTETTNRFGVWRKTSSLWVPSGTLRPKAYVGTLVDDNEVQKPYRFTITIGNMDGYDMIGAQTFPVVVHSDDLLWIISKPNQTSATVYEFGTYRVVDVKVYLDYTVRDKGTNQIYSTGTMFIQPGILGASIDISSVPAGRDLVIDIKVSSKTDEGVREFIKVNDNHFNKDSRVVEIHGTEYKAPITTQTQQDQQSGPSDQSDQSQQSGTSDQSDQSQQSGPSDQGDQSQQSGPSDQSEQSQQSGPSDQSDQSQQSGPSDQGDQSQQSGTSDQSDQSQQSGTSDQSDQSQQSGTSDQGDQSQQSGTSDQGDQSQQSGPSDQGSQSKEPEPTAPTPDFNGDGIVNIPDFLLFIDVFGTREGQANYDVKYDLDGNGEIGVPDFLLFVDSYGKEL